MSESARLDAFTLDAEVRERRRAASARRLHTLQIPALRLAGFGVAAALGVLHAPPGAAVAWLVAADLGYALAAALALRLLWRPHGRIDLSFALFHADVAVWLLTLRVVEPGGMAFGYLLLVRVADQVGFGFRRAAYFALVVVGLYLAYGVALTFLDPAAARWGERLGIAAAMALIGGYVATTGFVTQRLVERTRGAVRAARGLVASLEARTRELDQARREAEQASRAKSQFLAMVSHEIRTPMNGVLGATELLLWSRLDAVQRDFAEAAHRSAGDLLGLIDTMLDLSRIEAGRLAVEHAPFELRALLDTALALVRSGAQRKGLALETDIGADVPARAVGDALRLRQVLVNLLGNALKFTHAGHVRLGVRVRQASAEAWWLRFEVADTGIGIAPGQLGSIFDPFTQADASTTRDYGGSGLGLAIVRQLVQLMGGEVGVDSRPGVGSTFWFALELGRLPERAVGAAEAAPAALPAIEARVLLAEDNAVNQLVLQAMLRNLGCAVELAEDGAAAVAAARAGGIDLVLMDCHMPGIDGFEATRRIRADEAAQARARLPIVALTAAALPEDRARCFAAGMDDFLGKPVNLAQLAQVLARWTRRPGARAA